MYLLYHITVGIIFELYFCVLSPPLFYMPYPALKLMGILSCFKVPGDIQAAFLLQLAMYVATTICPLFYYRMDAVISPGHLLKKKWLEYSIYIFFYGISSIIYFPLMMLVLNYYDQKTAKTLLFDQFRVIYDDFWSPDVVAYFFNPWTYVIVGSCVLFQGISSFVLFISPVVIHKTLNHRSAMSEVTKHQHRQILKSLISLLVVLSSVILGFFSFMLYSLLVGHKRADILNIAELMAGAAFPVALLTYILTYSPYRNTIFQMFHKNMKVQRISAPSSMADEIKIRRNETPKMLTNVIP